jgi:proteasome alpha subunit
MFSAIGRQSDIENVRLSAIQTAHQEGFERSPDDVSLQRLVGFALSPALKKAFGDQMYVPVVIRALFAELGRTAAADCFFSLNYGQHTGIAVIAGSQRAEDRMLGVLGEPDASLTRDEAIRRALRAWVAGARDQISTNVEEDGDRDNPLRMVDEADADRVFLQDELKSGSLEVGFLQRRDKQDARFHLLTGDVLEKVISDLY